VGLPIICQAGPADSPTIVWLPGIEPSQRSEEESAEPPGFFSHIGLAVENIEGACQHFKEQGIEFDTPVKEMIYQEMGQRLKLVFFRDPDGISVEFVHWRERAIGVVGDTSIVSPGFCLSSGFGLARLVVRPFRDLHLHQLPQLNLL